ncbi:hypothetical protein D3C76_937780 [compost metagenome]
MPGATSKPLRLNLVPTNIPWFGRFSVITFDVEVDFAGLLISFTFAGVPITSAALNTVSVVNLAVLILNFISDS